eukprot:3327741-Pleurochrysis_carterae.AAC.1
MVMKGQKEVQETVNAKQIVHCWLEQYTSKIMIPSMCFIKCEMAWPKFIRRLLSAFGLSGCGLASYNMLCAEA